MKGDELPLKFSTDLAKSSSSHHRMWVSHRTPIADQACRCHCIFGRNLFVHHFLFLFLITHADCQWRIQNFIMGGGRSRGRSAPPKKKNEFEFLPETGGFCCILGLLFYVYATIGQIDGGDTPPESATADSVG